MKRQLKAMLYFFGTDMRHPFTIFWCILSAVIVVGLIAAYFLLNRIDGADFYFGISVSVYIFASIFGFKSVKENLPYTLKLGGTRKNYFVGIGAYFTLVAIITALMETVAHQLVTWITNMLNLETFYLIHPATLLNMQDSFFDRFLIDAIILIFCLISSYLLALIFYKYHLIVGLSIIGALFLTSLIMMANGSLPDLISELVINAALSQYGILFIITVVCYLLTWPILRNISTKSVRE
ncbi:hypothetical protein [Paraliobacillus ryukyuensis]|uniref:hypothetical protein n=1 Tax=Paraliobacillus ryukyuensis TaxID=200904 RepID=UPI0009A68A55|nr:hypothetical protein [Paraliobacillus ryukyuensis]